MLFRSDDSLQDFVDYLEKNMPSDVVISSFNITSGAVSISGKAGSKASVAKFIQQLQKSPSVINVDVPTISESKDNAGSVEATFSLTCTFVGTTSADNNSTSNKTK